MNPSNSHNGYNGASLKLKSNYMAKQISLEKVESQVEQLQLGELLSLQRKLVTLIAKQEQEAEDTILKAKEVLESIRSGGGK